MLRRLFLVLAFMCIGGVSTEAQDDTISATIYQTVNVRSGPGARFDIVAQVSGGAAVTVNGRDSGDSNWLHVTLADGKAGWVPAYVLTLQGDLAALPVMGEQPAPTSDAGVSVTAFGRVNVRSGPSITYPIVAQLDVDDTALVQARSNAGNDWLFIENAALSGWIAYFTVTVTGDPSALPIRVLDASGQSLVAPSVLIETRFNTRLHSEPVLESEIVVIIPFDREVTPLAKSDDGDWLYVAYEETTGWAFTNLFIVSAEQLSEIPVYESGVDYVIAEHGSVPVTPEATPALDATPESTPAARSSSA